MLDINAIRAQLAEYLAANASHRHSLDAAVMHVVQIAYRQGMSDAESGERAALQAAGEHPAPCARHCEANAFRIEIRRLNGLLNYGNEGKP